MRIPLVTAPLLASVSLAACSSAWKPPEIKYDDTPRQAVLQADPPKPVKIVELPKPLPLPGQLKPLPGTKAPADPADPHVRVEEANGAARVQPTRAGYINAMQVYPYSDGALYQVYAAPGQITDIALAAGEQLVGAGPVAAGDTVRWVIGDTESGTGPTKRVHILVKPTRAGPGHQSRHQHRPADLPCRAPLHREDLYGVGLVGLRARPAHRPAPAECRWQRLARRWRRGVDINALNFRYKIEGDTPPWRPLRAFDDGRQVFIAFPTGIGQGEMPPLWVIGPAGGAELVNYRIQGNHMVVDRLFAAAELRLGGETQKKVRIVRTDGRPQS